MPENTNRARQEAQTVLGRIDRLEAEQYPQRESFGTLTRRDAVVDQASQMPEGLVWHVPSSWTGNDESNNGWRTGRWEFWHDELGVVYAQFVDARGEDVQGDEVDELLDLADEGHSPGETNEELEDLRRHMEEMHELGPPTAILEEGHADDHHQFDGGGGTRHYHTACGGIIDATSSGPTFRNRDRAAQLGTMARVVGTGQLVEVMGPVTEGDDMLAVRMWPEDTAAVPPDEIDDLPGAVVHWTHLMRNTGPRNTPPTVPPPNENIFHHTSSPEDMPF